MDKMYWKYCKQDYINKVVACCINLIETKIINIPDQLVYRPKHNIHAVQVSLTTLFFFYPTLNRLRAKKGPAPPPREFCRHILTCREFQAASFKRCLHSVLRGVSL